MQATEKVSEAIDDLKHYLEREGEPENIEHLEHARLLLADASNLLIK